MIETLKKLRKLKGHSLDEWRVRGGQAFAIAAERGGFSCRAHLPGDGSFFKLLDASKIGQKPLTSQRLLEHFRSRTSPSFFPSFDSSVITLAELRQRFGPQAEQTTLERADRILEGRFDLLGLRDLRFGDSIDWHLEPVSSKRAPLRHWSQIDYLDSTVAGDKKIIWELNRHQHFFLLGQAYWYSRCERYAQTFIAHLNTWMDQNPPSLGINWASSLEVAFRSISWLWAFHFFRNSPYVTPQVFTRALKYLYIHASHLETFLSTYFSPNTHLTGEALGLFYLGTLLPEFREAERWRDTGRSILLSSLQKQVRDDGVYFEQASYYHRYTVDFYTHFYLLEQLNGNPIEKIHVEKLTALLDHLMYITRPDGTTPLFGDDDGGRLVMLDNRLPNDFRSSLATGAVLFARPDYKFVAGDVTEETLWLVGAERLWQFDDLKPREPEQLSKAFQDGGYYVMRDSWSRTANYLLIDCGPHGTLNCGHAHADALSIDLAAAGRTMLVDPGTYTYTGSQQLRDYFRSSTAHNTVTIDQESSSLPNDVFSWRQIASAWTKSWITHSRFDYFAGEHDGYQRLDGRTAHSREVLFLKDNYWIIRDKVHATGKHRCDVRFHFVPNSNPSAEAVRGSVMLNAQSAFAPGISIFTFGRDGDWQCDDGWISPCYGDLVAAPICTYSQTAEGSQEFVSIILPGQISRPKPVAYEETIDNIKIYQISGAHGNDLLFFRGSGPTFIDPFIGDFDWSWIRHQPGQEVFQEAVLLGGQHFSFADRLIIEANQRLSYLTLKLDGRELRIEADPDVPIIVRSKDKYSIRINGKLNPGREKSFLRHNVQNESK